MRAVVLAATFVALVGAAPALVGAQAGDANAGKAVYQLKCVGCHGEKGDGKGPAAELLVPQPRDFTSGIYKIRTTAGKAPSDQDLFKVITDGMPGTSMPSWAVLPEKERWNLVAKAEQAARLEPDDVDAACHIGGKRRDRALGLAARLRDQPDRQKGAAAA